MTGSNVAAVLAGRGRIEMRPVPVPRPSGAQVVVEVRSVGVCGSDVHYFEEGRIGSFVVSGPLVLGHEASGVVDAIGSDVRRVGVGDRVAIEPGIPCGHCEQCRTGRYNLCPAIRFLATPPVDGALTRLLLSHEDVVHLLPDGVSDDVGALIEPLSVGLWACRKANVGMGDRVLVTGAGAIGLVAMQVALACGASEVTVVDRVPARLERARLLGATHAEDVGSASMGDLGLEADVLLECTGVESVLGDGLRALRPAGRAVLVGMGPSEEARFPLAIVQNRELSLTGTFRYAHTYPSAIALVARGAVRLEQLIDAHYPLSAAADALRAARHDPTIVKAIVRPQEE